MNRNVRQKRIAGERGASLVEYALTVALIALVAVVSVAEVGASVDGVFSEYSSTMKSAEPDFQVACGGRGQPPCL